MNSFLSWWIHHKCMCPVSTSSKASFFSSLHSIPEDLQVDIIDFHLFICWFLINCGNFLGMIHLLVFTAWTSTSFWSAQVTEWAAAVAASLVLESNTGWPRMMPWNGSKLNTRVWSSISPRTSLVDLILLKEQFDLVVHFMFRLEFLVQCFQVLILRPFYILKQSI